MAAAAGAAVRRRAWAHVALAVVGVLVVVWVLTLGANPTITCRDVVMGPGDVCTDARGQRIQTYEERWRAAQAARPVIGGVGVALVAFGTALALGEHRKAANG